MCRPGQTGLVGWDSLTVAVRPLASWATHYLPATRPTLPSSLCAGKPIRHSFRLCLALLYLLLNLEHDGWFLLPSDLVPRDVPCWRDPTVYPATGCAFGFPTQYRFGFVYAYPLPAPTPHLPSGCAGRIELDEGGEGRTNCLPVRVQNGSMLLPDPAISPASYAHIPPFTTATLRQLLMTLLPHLPGSRVHLRMHFPSTVAKGVRGVAVCV